MVQPIRPQDASGIYQRQVGQAAAVDAAEHARRGAGGARSERADRVTLSEGAREFARVMDAVQSAPDTRADRVDELRSRIARGEYQVDHTGLAGLLYERGLR